MATPFKVFRDNQKILMVVFGALLMVAFVVLPPILQFGFFSQQVENERGDVVVEVDGEELYRPDVQNLVSKYEVVARVMAEAIGRSLVLQGSPKAPMPPIPGVRIIPASQQNPGGPQYQPVGAEEAVLYYAWVKRAEELGMVVDDQAVRDFMRETAGGRLSDYDYNAILGMVTGGEGRGITYDHFFEMVREVLMAQKLQALVFRDGRVVTPSAAWVAYRNMNRTISTEMFPVSSKDFMDKVGSPTSEQIEELFNKYKHQPANPSMNQIGFMQLDKISLAYVKGDIQDFVNIAKADITDEEVAKYYDENKDSFRKPQLPSSEPEASTESEDAAPMSETPSTEEAQPMQEESKEPASDEQPAEEMKKEEPAAEPMEEPKEDAPAEETPEEEKPAEEAKPSEESEAPATEEPKAEDSSMKQTDNDIQLVSFLQEEGETPAEEEKPAEEAPMEDAAPETTDAAAPMEETPMEEGPIEYKPLAEVQDQIRTRLAQPIAQKNMSEAMAEIRGVLQAKYEEFRYLETGKKDSPYDSNEIEKLATRLGLTFGAMPLSDFYDASQSAFAQEAVHVDYTFDQTSGLRTINRSLVAEAFQSNSPLFQPRLFPGASQSSMMFRQNVEPEIQYVFWKTEMQEGYAPKLDDVKDLVVKAWKEQEASKLAKEHAEKLAEQIKSADDLNKAASEAGAEVVVAENVTYFNQLSAGQNLTLGTIPGIEDISQATMEALFSAPVGSATVAPNAAEDVYYVSLITTSAETNEQLRDNMMAAIQGTLPASVSMYASQEENMVTRAMLLDFFDPKRIDWKIDPMDLDSNS